jgi:hypothetical protein
MQLSKKDKKVAREVIEKGLQREFEKGLSVSNSIIGEWKGKVINNRDAYINYSVILLILTNILHVDMII